MTDDLEADVTTLIYEHARQVTQDYVALVASLSAEGDDATRDAPWRGFAAGHSGT